MFGRFIQGIYWDKFWPLVDGCTPVDPTCDHCWRARYTHRFDATYHGRQHTTASGAFDGCIGMNYEVLYAPLHRKKPTVYFVLNDLFHEKVNAGFIKCAYEVMAEANEHIFIVCTKRPERIVPVLYEEEGRFYLGGGDYHSNIWHMTTAGNQDMADKRIPELLKLRQAAPWPVLGVSIEPMLGPIYIRYLEFARYNGEEEIWNYPPRLDWVILGGESGPGARPMHPEWARSIRDQCQSAGVPFFFKKHGYWNERYYKGSRYDPTNTDRRLDGKEYNELPEVK
ncbi:MAG: DUF5131 family protein [Candidatus Methanoperedens sp.]|nr:DUF5131 family protein [Candidatus Methanoperedens sp.]